METKTQINKKKPLEEEKVQQVTGGVMEIIEPIQVEPYSTWEVIPTLENEK